MTWVTRTNRKHGAEERKGDRPEAPPAAGPVDRRRLVELRRDVLEPREVDDEVVARDPPDGRQDDRPHRGRRVGEPCAHRHAGGLQVVVERSHHRVEQPEPRQPHGDHGQGERKEERASEDGPERNAAVQKHGEDQRHREDGQRARHGVEGGVDEAHLEPAVLQELLVVGEADEGVLHAPQPRVREGQPEAVQERVEAEGDEEQDAGQEEQVRGQGPVPEVSRPAGARAGPSRIHRQRPPDPEGPAGGPWASRP